MFKNFTEYWNAKKDMFERLDVTKDVAHMIWSDAANLAIELLREEYHGVSH